MTLPQLSQTEHEAMRMLHTKGSFLISQVPEKNERDILFGGTMPGLGIFVKLEKKGLCYITEEEPDETGFTFTPMIELTDEGAAFNKANFGQPSPSFRSRP